MTDEQEEPETVHAESQEQGHDAWQTELPPEDDFHDQPESSATVAEESDIVQNPFEGGGVSPKRSSKSLAIVAVVVVLFAGIFAFLYLGGEGKEDPRSLPFNASSGSTGAEEKQRFADEKMAAQQLASEGEAVKAVETAQSEIDSIYSAALTKTTGPEAPKALFPGETAQPQEGSAQTGAKTGMSDVMTTQPPKPISPAASGSTDAPQALGDMPMPQKSDALTSLSPPAGNAPALPAASAPSFSGSSDVAAMPQMLGQSPVELQVKELSQQIEGLKQSLQRLTEQTNVLANRLEASSPGMQDPAIGNRLNQLEQQLANLSQKTVKRKEEAIVDSGQKPDAESTGNGIAVSDSVKGPVAAVKKQPVKPKPKKTASARPRARQAAASWVLRAATPDSAWVSETAGSSELRQVQVGDNLPGIGVVRSIQQKGEGWVLEGSKGTIR